MEKYLLTETTSTKRELVAIVYIDLELYYKGYSRDNAITIVKDLFTPNYPNKTLDIIFHHEDGEDGEDYVEVFVNEVCDEIQLVTL